MCIALLSYAKDKTVTIDPNNIQFNSYVHKELTPELLKRIKATTDVFEIVDGTSYEKAVDLYKRDLDPESNIIIWEEMAKVYKKFCNNRCTTQPERMDVFRALLLRSMFSETEALQRLNTEVLNKQEAKFIVSQYSLEPKPIEVIQK